MFLLLGIFLVANPETSRRVRRCGCPVWMIVPTSIRRMPPRGDHPAQSPGSASSTRIAGRAGAGAPCWVMGVAEPLTVGAAVRHDGVIVKAAWSDRRRREVRSARTVLRRSSAKGPTFTFWPALGVKRIENMLQQKGARGGATDDGAGFSACI